MRRTLALTAVLVLTLAACGDSDDGTASTTTASQATIDACESEARTLEVAIEVYYATKGSNPATLDELVTADLIRPDAFRYHDVNPDARPDDTVILSPAGEAAGCPAP